MTGLIQCLPPPSKFLEPPLLVWYELCGPPCTLSREVWGVKLDSLSPLPRALTLRARRKHGGGRDETDAGGNWSAVRRKAKERGKWRARDDTQMNSRDAPKTDRTERRRTQTESVPLVTSYVPFDASIAALRSVQSTLKESLVSGTVWQCDYDNLKWNKYVYIAIYQPDTKSNPNPNPNPNPTIQNSTQ